MALRQVASNAIMETMLAVDNAGRTKGTRALRTVMACQCVRPFAETDTELGTSNATMAIFQDV